MTDGRTHLRLHRVEVREALGEERLELRGAQGRDGEGLQVQQLLCLGVGVEGFVVGERGMGGGDVPIVVASLLLYYTHQPQTPTDRVRGELGGEDEGAEGDGLHHLGVQPAVRHHAHEVLRREGVEDRDGEVDGVLWCVCVFFFCGRGGGERQFDDGVLFVCVCVFVFLGGGRGGVETWV